MEIHSAQTARRFSQADFAEMHQNDVKANMVNDTPGAVPAAAPAADARVASPAGRTSTLNGLERYESPTAHLLSRAELDKIIEDERKSLLNK